MAHVNSAMHFYTADGKLVAQQHVPVSAISGMAWHRSSLQLALATPNAVALYLVRRGKVTGVGMSLAVSTPSGGTVTPPMPVNSSAASSSPSPSSFVGDGAGRWRCVALRKMRHDAKHDSSIAKKLTKRHQSHQSQTADEASSDAVNKSKVTAASDSKNADEDDDEDEEDEDDRLVYFSFLLSLCKSVYL